MNGAGIVVDLFAGGGGASEGIARAIGRDPDIAINHDAMALAMHAANHPETRHYHSNIWEVDPLEATGGEPVRFLWASPDCKHFSKAKGGKPRDKNIRALAWVVISWASKTRPEVIALENVEEFQTWGPLDADGMPDKTKTGQTFRAWWRRLERLGYRVEKRELRAADYGAPTIRKRLFIIARRDGEPIIWPEPTHEPRKPGEMASLFGRAPYRTAAECIDWTRPCPSIFERERELAPATMRRIARGIQRYVIDAARPFIVPLTHQGSDARVYSADAPLPTVTGAQRGEQAVIAPTLVGITHNKSGDHITDPVDQPLRTVTTSRGGELAAVTPFLTRFNENGLGSEVTEPVDTVMAGAPRFGLAAVTMVQTGYGEREGQAPRAIDIQKPLGTVVDGGKHATVAAFLAKHNGGHEATGSALHEPASTITAQDHQAPVAATLVHLRGTGAARSVEEPLPTTTAGGFHVAEVRAFLLKYYGNDKDGQGLADPLHTVTAKERFALGVVYIGGEPYQIVDIGMRMLEPRELFRAQGFGDDYVIDPEVEVTDARGKTKRRRLTKTEQIRMCGNSVCPPVAEAIVSANVGRVLAAEAVA